MPKTAAVRNLYNALYVYVYDDVHMYIFKMPEIILGRALDCIPQKMVRLGTMSEHI